MIGGGAGAHHSQRGGVILWALLALGAIVLLAVGYLAVALHWPYSEGERAGVVQKLSHKGWLFKTWEGELAMATVPGVAPVIWRFTVRNDEAVVELSRALGKQAVVHYTEHRGLPVSWFGETTYFVDRVRLEEDGATAAPEL